MDDTFQPVTPLIDGAVVSEMTYNVSIGTLNPTNHTYQWSTTTVAPLRDDRTLELLDCSESSPA